MIPPQNVSEAVYRRAVEKRVEWCRRSIKRYGGNGEIAVLVLSCKRPIALDRLLVSLKNHVIYPKSEQGWFVDNGSSYEVVEAYHRSITRGFLFDKFIWNRVNMGMGHALNAALAQMHCEYVMFIEDDLVLDWQDAFYEHCKAIFREFPEIGIIKLKRKEGWGEKPFRRIGPRQTTSTGINFHPWLPSPRWTFRWGQRPWYPVGIHNVWSLGPVMFRWCAWADAGPIPSGQGRGQAIAAEEEYARVFNQRWLAAKLIYLSPFIQPPTPESPGFQDRV